MHLIKNAELTYVHNRVKIAYLIYIILISAKLNYMSVLLCIKFAIKYHERC